MPFREGPVFQFPGLWCGGSRRTVITALKFWRRTPGGSESSTAGITTNNASNRSKTWFLATDCGPVPYKRLIFGRFPDAKTGRWRRAHASVRDVSYRMNPLQELFLDELKDMYDAEKRIVKALPKLAKVASSEALKTAFRQHQEETKGQIEKLEQVFESIGEKPKGKACKATIGLLEEGDEIAEEHGETTAGNAALISAAQKVEHYEIASYGCLVTWARLLKYEKAVELLSEILEEEEKTNQTLTEIGETSANEEGLSEESEEDEEEAHKRKKK